MPSHQFMPGDACDCMVHLCNPTETTFTNVPLIVMLEVAGNYFFAPSFTGADHYLIDLPPGESRVLVVPTFFWPENSGSADDVGFYAAMTNADMTEMFGLMDIWKFKWGM